MSWEPTKGGSDGTARQSEGSAVEECRQVDTAIDKAGDVVDRKYKGTVDKVEEEAKKFGIGE